MPNKKYLSAKDIGKILEVSRQAVQQWVVSGRLKSSKVGRSYRVDPGDLLNYLESLGNSKTAMDKFKKDINSYLQEKKTVKELNNISVERSKAKISFLINGIKNSENVLPEYIRELKKEMELLQTVISEKEYKSFMINSFGFKLQEVEEFLDKAFDKYQKSDD